MKTIPNYWIISFLSMFLLVLSSFASADVVLKKRNDKCKKNCSQTLIVGNKSFSYNHKAKLILSSSYANIEWALVSLPVKKNKKTKTYYYLHNSQNRKRFSTQKICNGLDRDISAKGELVCITNDNVTVVGQFSGNKDLTFPFTNKANVSDETALKAEVAVVDHYRGGTINFAYISEVKNEYDGLEYHLYVSDLLSLKKSQLKKSPWVSTKTNLHKNSDFSEILAVNSRGDSQYSAAVYEWINPYNKGLTAYNFTINGKSKSSNSENNTVYTGRINTSELHNFGFSPKVLMTKNDVFFSAKNSSTRQREEFRYANSELTKMKYEQHEFASASFVEFMFGAGFQSVNWSVDQTVEVDDVTKAETKYDMNTNVLSSYYIQGRWGDSQLAVSLLQNKAKEKVNHAIDNDLLQEVVKKYIVQYDYHGLFSGASTLRLVYSSMNAGGIATYEDSNLIESEYAFESERTTYQALVMAEKGMYWGGYYSTYDSPSMVGFVNENGRFSGAAFDKNFSLTKYGLVIGYDEGWYGNRYETDYNRWYVTGEFGLGGVYLHTDRDALFDAVGTRAGDINGKNTIEVKGTLDFGYIWQRRIKSLRGLGLSLLAGYQAQFEYIDSNSDDDDELDDGWTLHYQRKDITHGPYVKLNVIF